MMVKVRVRYNSAGPSWYRRGLSHVRCLVRIREKLLMSD